MAEKMSFERRRLLRALVVQEGLAGSARPATKAAHVAALERGRKAIAELEEREGVPEAERYEAQRQAREDAAIEADLRAEEAAAAEATE